MEEHLNFFLLVDVTIITVKVIVQWEWGASGQLSLLGGSKYVLFYLLKCDAVSKTILNTKQIC